MHLQHVWASILFSTCAIRVLVAQDTENPCVGLKTCATCIQHKECAWCSQSDFHGQDKRPLPRCDTVKNHEAHKFKCNSAMLFIPSNKVIVERNESLSNGLDDQKAVPIQPQRLSLALRVNDPVSFDMKYREVEDYPLELYYLMDGTFSMRDDKEVLVSLGDLIGERLRTLTSKFRQGFGTFVDKVTMPFVSRIPALFENPCLTENYSCIEPYGFKNHMPLTNNTSGFTDAVKAFNLSASSDFAEGGLDALMQVMVCEKQIGWSKQARRLIIFATDGTFHYAGDGRLGGIILPNDGECHLDSNGRYYTHSTITDYPSMAQINSKAKEHSINIIFAVTSEILEDYKTLTRVIEGSDSTELAKNSSNIVDLVVDQYERITSKVEIKDNFPQDFFKVTYYSKCHASDTEKETNICEKLQPGIVVEFRIKIELIKCPPRKEEWKQQYKIYAVGVPDFIELDVETLCDCPCEDPLNGIKDSPLCNYKGTEICGLCECKKEHFGEFCECSSNNSTRVDDGKACKRENSTETCSGRGNCICRQCVCTDKRYSGPYCECDNQNCLLVAGELCAGHGTCDCGKCVCNSGWRGTGCECSTDRSTCMEPGSDVECSGQGKCTCGKCGDCQKGYGGQYCEICRAESCQKCEELKDCVQCKAFKTGDVTPADCQLKCFMHSIELVDVISAPPKSDEVVCKAEDLTDDCVFIFSYKSSKREGIKIKVQETKECPPKAPIFLIISIVSSIVVIIGLILLCVYRGYRSYQIKKEYAAYKKEKDNLVWGQQVNPIYNDPIGVFKNPIYAGND